MLSVWAVIAAGTMSARGADVETTGSVEQDVRQRVERVPFGPWYAPAGLNAEFTRIETTLNGRMRVRSQNMAMVADLSLVLNAMSEELMTLEDLSVREGVAPISLEANELYLDVWELFGNLDLRIGHQVVQWGVGDQFNPTNNLNADDLEDPLKFGQQLPNFMARMDWAFGRSWTLSYVAVPIFRPAMLPRTAPVGVAALSRLPMVEDEVRWKIHSEQALARDWSLLNYPTIVAGADPQMPAASPSNIQQEVRIGGSVGLQDLALSFYNGRSDIPQAGKNFTQLVPGVRCHPERSNDCISGMLVTEVDLIYPKMRVIGFNGAGEFSPLSVFSKGARPWGWRLEAALVVPERTTVEIENAALPLGALTQPAGEYDYGLQGERPAVIDGRPFAKWTLGLDYTPSKNVYLNGQWVHGLADEFGAGDFLTEGWVVRDGGVTGSIESISDCVVVDESGKKCAWEMLRHRIGDYAVLGADFTFGPTLFRVFTLFDMTGYVQTKWDEDKGERTSERHHAFSKEGFSAVVFPELSYNFGNGLVAGMGTIFMFGQPHTKFGDPAAGGDLVFARGKYSF